MESLPLHHTHPQAIKPKARGWIHAVTAPLALANGIVLICLAPTVSLKVSCAVFTLCSFVLFGHSAVYHLGNWGTRVHALLRRMDHSNIFLLIAGTYTPLSVALLPGRNAFIVLLIVWTGAFFGISLAILKPEAPRWLTTILYVALGWVALWYLPAFWFAGGPAVVWLIASGGILYTVGAIFYASRWPNPWPRVWGFHEFFHACTLAAFACQVVAVWLAIF